MQLSSVPPESFHWLEIESQGKEVARDGDVHLCLSFLGLHRATVF
jgi:hypothetical protein